MADSPSVDDLVAAVSGVLGNDRPTLSGIAADATQRSKARMLDALKPATLGSTAADQLPAPVERPLPRPRRDRAVEITFQDGRRVRAKIAPAVARRSDLSALARASAVNNRRTFTALRRQRRAIKRLRRSHDDLAKRIDALDAQKDRAVVGLAQGLAGLARRVRDVSAQTQAVAVATGVAAPAPATGGTAGVTPPRQPVRPVQQLQTTQQMQRQQLQQLQQTKLLAVRTQIQAATNVVNSVQAAAFGQRGSVFAKNNLVLAGTQLFWGMLDPVLQSTGVIDATAGTILAALAPIGTLFTGEIVLGDQQHERFISGVDTLDANGAAVVSLRGQVAEGFWPTFRQRTDVLVTAKVVEPPALSTRSVFARVEQGSLVLELQRSGGASSGTPLLLSSIPGSVRVAWTIDLGADIG